MTFFGCDVCGKTSTDPMRHCEVPDDEGIHDRIDVCDDCYKEYMDFYQACAEELELKTSKKIKEMIEYHNKKRSGEV